ncbi:MAG TPA: rod shape-determining protein MreC [Acidimicrobiia bacterium]|nr:rod shape-determining protein MreC [Acidimicrobiia bacterium]
MAVYRRSQRRTVLVLLVLTSITLVTLDLRGGSDGPIGFVRRTARDAFAPVESGADALFRPLGDFLDGISRSGSLKSENRALHKRIDDLEGQLARAGGLDRENEVLRKLLNLPFAGEIETLAAKVVSFAPGNFEWTATIDRGSRDGIEEDMPVVSGEGLVGRIIEVSDTRAKILLLTDPRMSVGIRLAGVSDETGVTTGLAGKDVLQVDLIDPDTPVDEEELVVTSGLQQARFPPGIPVGTVVSVSTRRGALQKDLRVRPLADLERIEFVEVLLWKNGSPVVDDATPSGDVAETSIPESKPAAADGADRP